MEINTKKAYKSIILIILYQNYYRCNEEIINLLMNKIKLNFKRDIIKNSVIQTSYRSFFI